MLSLPHPVDVREPAESVRSETISRLVRMDITGLRSFSRLTASRYVTHDVTGPACTACNVGSQLCFYIKIFT